MFPVPGYFHSKVGVVWLWHLLLNLHITKYYFYCIYIHSDALIDGAIRPWVQLALRANFVQLLQFHLFVQCWRSISVFAFVSHHINREMLYTCIAWHSIKTKKPNYYYRHDYNYHCCYCQDYCFYTVFISIWQICYFLYIYDIIHNIMILL